MTARARLFVFVTHPNVAIDPAVPVPQWPLSPRGRERMRQALRQPWVRGITAIYCSAERKAIDGARILGAHLGLTPRVHAALGENDRSSTGYRPPPEFERLADAFFSQPDVSVSGWERAVDAQQRIVQTLQAIDRNEPTAGPVAIVSHGAVGALLQCWLAGAPISRTWDQPGEGGGNCFSFTLRPPVLRSRWQAIDAAMQEGAP